MAIRGIVIYFFIIYIFIESEILANSSHQMEVVYKCGQTEVIRKNNISEKYGLYLKFKHRNYEIKGDLFENLLFFAIKDEKFLAVFTLEGAHVHIVTFFKVKGDKLVKVENGVIFFRNSNAIYFT